MAFYENENKKQLALLLQVDTGEYDADASIEELSGLVETAGGEVYASLVQKRDKADNVTYLGSGKLNEAKEICENADIDIVICDTELSPTQTRKLENIFGVRVIDRTVLILDIFAQRAKTNEGKLQVELAQLNYMLPRLTGKGASLSRLGGGIGTRGPGESKLESDKRHIRRRIHALENELELLSKRRERHRERRRKDGVISCAIVGYTNAGKSTLLNYLTNAGVLAEDKLFATLDPTARSIKLPDGSDIMLIDTVGFISRLPHFLVEAFKSTLEEATNADLILILCDASDSECEQQLEVTKEILRELGAEYKPTVTVYNKCDKTNAFLLEASHDTVRICATTGIGVNKLLEVMADKLPKTKQRLKLLIPFNKGSLAARVRSNGRVNSEKYREDGIELDAVVDIQLMKELMEYIIDEKE